MSAVKKTILFIFFFALSRYFSQPQQDSLITFKIGNGQSPHTLKKNELLCDLGLLFGEQTNAIIGAFDGKVLNDVNLNCNYGLVDNLSIGIGISNINSLINGTLKYRILNQSSTTKIPLSIAYYGSMSYTFKKTSDLYANVIKTFDTKEAHRINYFHQIILSSKPNSYFFVEVMPTYVYRNFIKESVNINNSYTDVNGFFSLGFIAKIKLSKNVSAFGNYFYNFANYYKNNPTIFNPMSIGFEANIKQNKFSIYATNANGLIENNYIAQTSSSWKNGQIKIGLGFSRLFAL
ncbi:MAG: DUF5777 family beta-barrel protein [Bacteroidota bacterium]|nr:DUF5777 family beta-barrel protein [Bacteroidota bacterium]